MKDYWDGIILLLAAGIIGLLLFFGISQFLAKGYQKPKEQPLDSSEMLNEQKKRMEEIERRQKDLKRQQKQKMRDFRNQR